MNDDARERLLAALRPAEPWPGAPSPEVIADALAPVMNAIATERAVEAVEKAQRKILALKIEIVRLGGPDDLDRLTARADLRRAEGAAMTEDGGDGDDELRDQWARKLFHEYVTGLQSAWTSEHWEHVHYRTECYRVADELLADRERHARERAADELRRVASGVGDGAGIVGLPGAVKQALGIAAGVIYVRADELASEAAS